MTTYFIDFTNGLDTNDGLGTGTAWQTINKFTNAARSAGDICWVRNGGTHPTISAHITFVSGGNINNPIILKADDGSQWTADKTTLTNTYTLTYGSQTVTASATESELAADKQVYFGTENDKIYEVLSVSGTTVTIWPPYRGDLTGAGNGGIMLPAKPLVSIGGGAYQWQFSPDHWLIKGFKTGNATVASFFSSGRLAVAWEDITFYDLTANAAIQMAAGTTWTLKRSRTTNVKFGVKWAGWMWLDDCLIDGNSIASSYGIDKTAANYSIGYIYNSILKNNASADINFNLGQADLYMRKVDLQSTTKFANYLSGTSDELVTHIYSEDHGGTVGDSRIFMNFDETANVATLQSETTTVRSGGSDKSVKCIGSSDFGITRDNTRVKLFESVYYQPASAKTYTVYFNLPAAEFTAAPLATELYIELEYFETSTARKKKKSTGTVLADGNWNTLTVSATPSIAGQAYLRAYYCKTKEAGKTNTFYTDPIATVS